MTDTAKPTATVSLEIDGTAIEVPKGTLVIRAAEELGIVIPRFCDHPLLDPIGACRQCMVEVEGQRKPFTACTTQCTEGMVVRTHRTSDVAENAQEGVLEMLLMNHPLDCPQCDKGGECPLQDQALAHGRADSRFIDDKRRYEKAIPISAQVLLDRERCVLCARCTRFSQEISGDPFIELFERGALEQVAIYEDEPYESYYSGNVVQICPVGALTSASYRFGARPFDLRSTPSVCNQCANGCNLRVDVRRGEIQRQLARDNMAVNESWNCDRGRFAYAYVAAAERLQEPLVRDDVNTLRPTTWMRAVQTAAAGFASARDSGGPQAVGVITGGRLTDEDAYALSRFARDVLGTDNVDSRLAPREEELDVLAAVSGTLGPTYDEVERAPLVVIAGLDPEEEAPILHLRLRKAWRRRGQKVVVVGPTATSAEEYTWRWEASDVGGERAVLSALAGEGGDDGDVRAALRAAGAGVVVLAGERLAHSPGALAAAADLARAVGGRFAWIPRRTNSRGALDAGLLPGLLPGGRPLTDPGPVADAWRGLPGEGGLDTRGMLEAAAGGELRALYLAGVDLACDFEDPALARAALERVDHLVVVDLLPTETTRYADVVLPACSSQERVGSFTTWEGRRQPFPQALASRGLAQEDWDIIRQLARALDADLGWETAMDVRREAAPLMEAAGPELAGERPRAGDADAATPLAARAPDELDVVVVPQLLGTGSMLTGADALVRTARRPAVRVHPDDAARLGVADGDVVRVAGDHAALELPLHVTPTVVAGACVLPAQTPSGPAGSLHRGTAGWRVRLETAQEA